MKKSNVRFFQKQPPFFCERPPHGKMNIYAILRKSKRFAIYGCQKNTLTGMIKNNCLTYINFDAFFLDFILPGKYFVLSLQ